MSEKKILIIQGNQYGFFSSFIEVLDNLLYCKRNNVTPMVKFTTLSEYYGPNGYNGFDNVWEYYFEPITTPILEGDKIGYVFNNFLAKEIPQSFGHRNTETSGMMRNGFNIVNDYYRNEANTIISEFISINRVTSRKISEFYVNNFKPGLTHKIGVHIRGGRGAKETWHKDNIKLEYYKIALDELLESLNIGEFDLYVASDSAEAIEFMRSHYRNCISYPCFRTPGYYIGNRKYSEVQEVGVNKDNRTFMKSARPEIGEQALIECMLLSKCRIIIHHELLLTNAAAYFNPQSRLIHLEKYVERFEGRREQSQVLTNIGGTPGDRFENRSRGSRKFDPEGGSRQQQAKPCEAGTARRRDEIRIRWMRACDAGGEPDLARKVPETAQRAIRASTKANSRGKPSCVWVAEQAGTVVGIMRAAEWWPTYKKSANRMHRLVSAMVSIISRVIQDSQKLAPLRARLQRRRYWRVAIDAQFESHDRCVEDVLLERLLEMADAQRSPVSLEIVGDRDVRSYVKLGFTIVIKKGVGCTKKHFLWREPAGLSMQPVGKGASWLVLPWEDPQSATLT